MADIDFRTKGAGSIRWTASDFDESIALAEFPYIELIEYEQEFSSLLANINYWEQRISGRTNDAYRGLYLGSPTGNTYILPFFMDTHHQIGQSWQENSAPLGPWVRGIADAVENVAKTFFPTAGIIYPKAYAGANQYAYDINFSLLNTIDEVGLFYNKFFLELFISQNLHVQHNALTITPPCLYEVYIPGVRWSPVAVVSNLTVTNIGTLNRIPNVGGGNYIVPDAWNIQIQIQELINESRDIYLDAIVGRGSGADMSIRVIESAADTPVGQAAQGVLEGAQNAAEGLDAIQNNLGEGIENILGNAGSAAERFLRGLNR